MLAIKPTIIKMVFLTSIITAFSISPLAQADSNIPPEVEKMHAFLGLMQKFYSIVDSMNKVSSDPTEAAIMQMFKIQEIYEQRGEKAKAAEVFRRVLQESKNPTLRNAATIMLGDVLKDTGQADAAITALTNGLIENVKRAE